MAGDFPSYIQRSCAFSYLWRKVERFQRLSSFLGLAAAQAVLWRFWRQQGWIQSPWQREDDCMMPCSVLRDLQTPDLSFLRVRTASSPVPTAITCAAGRNSCKKFAMTSGRTVFKMLVLVIFCFWWIFLFKKVSETLAFAGFWFSSH